VGGKTITVLLRLPYIYLRVGGKTIKGKPWAKADIAAYTRALGAGEELNTSVDPSKWIDYLKAAGEVTVIGHETLRGVPATHYHVLVDLTRYQDVVPAALRVQARQQAALIARISGQSHLPIDVWVDAKRLIRRYQVDTPLCFNGQRASESVNVELYGYGRQTIPQPPPAFEVSDITSRLTSSASRGLQELHC
jgi:hypothetical protein